MSTDPVSTDDREFYNGYSVDDEDQPQSTGDSLTDSRGLPEPMEEGYSPPEKLSGAHKFGTTPYEESLGEPLDERVRQEEPEPDPYVSAAEDPDVSGSEVGDRRAGRLAERDDAVHAEDVGIDGAAASAEEAAVHVIDEYEDVRR